LQVARLPVVLLSVITLGAAIACAGPQATAAPVALRLQVSLTAEELADFRPALQRVDDAHPEFTVALEEVPQGSEVEKVTTQLAADDLPDVLRVQGLTVQQWIRRGAFLDLTSPAASAGIDTADFYTGPLDQFRFDAKLWGIPDTASPDVVFFNRTMFEAAGIDEPTDDWTLDDMRTAAIALTLDDEGRHPGDAGFDADNIVQWGLNGGLTFFWQNHFIKARGGDLCANDDCTQMSFTSAANKEAMEWWASLIRDDHAALYDPFGGSQTGVEGDPFLSGKAAMGTNGAFAIGQLNAADSIDYDIIPPFVGVDGKRYTSLSTNGYVISAHSEHPNESMALLNALVARDFLETTWAAPGHAVPARKSAAPAVTDTEREPQNDDAILTAMESGEVFRPNTAHAFDAYGATVEIFTKMNTGELTVDEAAAQLEAAANEALEPDRSP
jgi:multiple sugar transport system substrate-binding protein